MTYHGDFLAGSVVRIPISFAAAAGGRVDPSTALELADFLLYKDGGATERTSTAGWTITQPFDSKTGLGMLLVDTSDDTDAGFYAAGHDYHVALYPDETVDGQSVAAWVGSFSIENRNVKADVQKWLGTTVATPDTAGYPKVTIKDGTGTGELDTASGKVSLVTGDITSIQSGLATAAALDVVDNFLDTEIATIISLLAAGRVGIASEGVLDAGSATTFTLPTGQRLNVAPGFALWVPGKGRPITIAAGYDSGTGAGSLVSSADSAFAASDPYYVLAMPKAEPLQAVDFADDALTAAKFAADVATEFQAGLATAAALDVVDDLLDTEIAAIKAKTDNLPADPADASDIAASFASIASTLSTLSGYLDTEVAAILAAVDTEVAAIKAKTDALPSDPADASDVAAVLADIQARIPTALTAGGRIKASIEAIADNATAATNLAASTLGIIPGLAQTGTLSTTQMTTNLTFANANQVKDRIIVWTSGDLNRAVGKITASTTGGLLTFSDAAGNALPAAPANNDTFVIV